MKKEDFEYVCANRQACENTLVDYVLTDTVLYVSKDTEVYKEYGKKLENAICCVNGILGSSYKQICGFEVENVLYEQECFIRQYLSKLDILMFQVLFFTALNLRSVLLGVLFVENKLSVEDVFELAFFEELYQQKKWGTDDVILCKQHSIKVNLQQLEKVKNERSLFEN